VEINRTAQAGTLESSDIMITVAPREKGSGVVIELESIVLAQYGNAIRQVLASLVSERDITDLYIKAVDRGALDCTIQARLLTALARGSSVPEGELV